MGVTINDVKKLREETGVSIIKCKKALEESEGDIEKARKVLRQKSKEVVDKKKDRSLGAGRISSYIHNNRTIGVLIELSCETDFVAKNEEFVDLAYEIAMHIAAMNPLYLSIDDVPEEEKKSVQEELEKEFSDKPKDIQKKAVDSKLKSHFSELVLLEQTFIKDSEKTVKNLIEEAVQKFGERIEVTRFTRYQIDS